MILMRAEIKLLFLFELSQEEGYSYQHTLAKWSHLGYASHWVAGLTFVFHLII